MCYDDTDSEIYSVGCGVPDGSSFFLLFFIYVHDLAFVSTELVSILFVDDAHFFAQ